MPDESSVAPSAPVFRVDRFIVPSDALPAFMARVHQVDRMLGALPGCRQNLVLTRTDGGESEVVTLVEWANTDTLLAAKALMQRSYADEGFDPAAFMQQLGVRGDLGLYAPA